MTEAPHNHTSQAPTTDVDALCIQAAACTVTMSPIDQLAVMQSFDLSPDNQDDMAILYAAVQLALSRMPRQEQVSGSSPPQRSFSERFPHLSDDDDNESAQDAFQPQNGQRANDQSGNSQAVEANQFSVYARGDAAVGNVQYAFGDMEISPSINTLFGDQCRVTGAPVDTHSQSAAHVEYTFPSQ